MELNNFIVSFFFQNTVSPSLAEKDVLERKLLWTLRQVAIIKSQIRFYEGLLKNDIHMALEDYEVDIKKGSVRTTDIHHRLANYIQTVDKDVRKFVLIELQEKLAKLSQTRKDVEEQYRNYTNSEMAFVELERKAESMSGRFIENQNKKLHWLIATQTSETSKGIQVSVDIIFILKYIKTSSFMQLIKIFYLLDVSESQQYFILFSKFLTR